MEGICVGALLLIVPTELSTQARDGPIGDGFPRLLCDDIARWPGAAGRFGQRPAE